MFPGACEGTLACSTCHLIFKEADYEKIGDNPTDEELDMLDLAFGLTDTYVSLEYQPITYTKNTYFNFGFKEYWGWVYVEYFIYASLPPPFVYKKNSMVLLQ